MKSAEALILDAVERTGIPRADLLGRRRTRRLVWARQRLMLDLFVEGWRMKQIGIALDRDHATVSAGIRQEVRRLLRAKDKGAPVGNMLNVKLPAPRSGRLEIVL